MQMSFSGDDAFNAMLYGDKNPDTVSYLRDKISRIPDNVTEYGRSFMNRSRQVFDHYNSVGAVRFAREILSKVQGTSKPDVVYKLTTVEELRNAGSVMQRFAMANPMVNRRYLRQQIDGYSETYTNVHGDAVGDDNYDYRRVNQGMVNFDGLEEGDGWKCTQYGEELKPGDIELDILQQIDIKDTWRWEEYLLALGKDDFTDKNGGKL